MGRRRRLSAIRAALGGAAAGRDVDPHPSSQRPLRIAIVLGTTRDGRQGHRVALFCQLALEAAGHAVTLIDPRETPLPLLEKAYQHYDEDELPRPPLLDELAEKLWAADTIVCVSAEYNHTIPPALTNLLGHFGPSFLLEGKPAGLVTYSAAWHGGRFAAIHLRALCGELGMISSPNIFSIGAVYEQLDADGGETEIGADAGVASRFERFSAQLCWHAAALRSHREACGVGSGPSIDPMPQPSIGGEEVVLRQMRSTEEEADALIAFYDEVPFEDAIFYGPACADPADVRKLVMRQESDPCEVRLVLATPQSGEILGETYFKWGSATAGSPEPLAIQRGEHSHFGICLSRRAQGEGRGREMISSLLAIAANYVRRKTFTALSLQQPRLIPMFVAAHRAPQ